LARLTLNVAQVHHDARAAGGRRLVYGGHTIGVAAAQVTRALPGVATFLGWESCHHTGPVSEGDTLRSTVTEEDSTPYLEGLHVVRLRSVVTAESAESVGEPAGAGEPGREVLDWRFSVLM
jgi:acyl dehydratase